MSIDREGSIDSPESLLPKRPALPGGSFHLSPQPRLRTDHGARLVGALARGGRDTTHTSRAARPAQAPMIAEPLSREPPLGGPEPAPRDPEP